MELSESDMRIARRRAMWKIALLFAFGLVIAVLFDEILRRAFNVWIIRELARYFLMAILVVQVVYVGMNCRRWYRAYPQKTPRWLYALMCWNTGVITFVPVLFLLQFRWF